MKKLVVTEFKVILVDYCFAEAKSTTVTDFEKILSDACAEGCTSFVTQIGKPKVIASGKD